MSKANRKGPYTNPFSVIKVPAIIRLEQKYKTKRSGTGMKVRIIFRQDKNGCFCGKLKAKKKKKIAVQLPAKYKVLAQNKELAGSKAR